MIKNGTQRFNFNLLCQSSRVYPCMFERSISHREIWSDKRRWNIAFKSKKSAQIVITRPQQSGLQSRSKPKRYKEGHEIRQKMNETTTFAHWWVKSQTLSQTLGAYDAFGAPMSRSIVGDTWALLNPVLFSLFLNMHPKNGNLKKSEISEIKNVRIHKIVH